MMQQAALTASPGIRLSVQSEDECPELAGEPELGGARGPARARLAAGLLAAAALAGTLLALLPAHDASFVSPPVASIDAVQLEEDPCAARRLSSAKTWQYGQEEPGADPCVIRGAVSGCSGIQEDCSSTQCCSPPGSQCYAKHEGWALCMASCNPGPQPSDVDWEWWSCQELGGRSAGERLQCAGASGNCMESKCCSDAGMACFEKNQTFGSCRDSCIPGPQYTDDDWKPWTCEQLGQFTPGKGEWVEDVCAGDTENCHDSKCCKSPGYQCYEMNEGFATCLPECTTKWIPSALASCPTLNTSFWEEPWTCREIGSRTPKPAAASAGKVSPWVYDRCSSSWDEDCRESRCCSGVGMACYEKDEDWATCRENCEAGPDEHNEYWSCNQLGPRLSGFALEGFPSLLCFVVFQVETYERALLQYQYDNNVSVFKCDQALLFADKPIEFKGTKVLQTPNVTVGRTIDGTAGNTELFVKVWDLLIDEGSYQHHHWTIKVDPDAVVLPDKLRIRLAPHTHLEPTAFIVNCNAWPGMPTFPMMYGAVEVFSMKAVQAFSQGVDGCLADLPWQSWSEDAFLDRCLKQDGVGTLLDMGMVGDALCAGPGQFFQGDCNDPEKAAFHPFKDLESWTQCFRNATNR